MLCDQARRSTTGSPMSLGAQSEGTRLAAMGWGEGQLQPRALSFCLAVPLSLGLGVQSEGFRHAGRAGIVACCLVGQTAETKASAGCA